jgi:hypothetical protein
MPKENMSPKERWLVVFKRGKPDRIPMDFSGRDETVAAYKMVTEVERRCAWPIPDWWDCSVLPERVKGDELYPIQ